MIPNNYTIPQNGYENSQNSYITTSKKYVRNLIDRIVQCTPLLMALAAVGIAFWLIPQIEARVPEDIPPTTEPPPVLDDVVILPIHNNVVCHIEPTRQEGVVRIVCRNI